MGELYLGKAIIEPPDSCRDIVDFVIPTPAVRRYGEGCGRAREGESYTGIVVVEDMVYVDEVEVEAGVLLLDSTPPTLEDPFPLEGAGLDLLDPHGVLPKRPLFEVELDEPLTLRLATCPPAPPNPFSPLPVGSTGLGGGGGQGPAGLQGKAARNRPT